MLQVRIENIDQTFIGVFNVNWSGDGPMVAAQQALDDLIKNHQFFKDNRVHKMSVPDDEQAFGILLLDGYDPDEEVQSEGTYLIYVSEFKLGTMVAC